MLRRRGGQHIHHGSAISCIIAMLFAEDEYVESLDCNDWLAGELRQVNARRDDAMLGICDYFLSDLPGCL